MISKQMAEALNDHLNKELYSAYLYMSMSSHSHHIGLKGFANWFDIQVQEELLHVQRAYGYLLDQGTKVILEAIDKPPTEFKSAVDLFETTLNHEKQVTARINELVGLANKENDYATSNMLQWFVGEQVEEETSVGDIIQRLKLVGNDGTGLLMIDKELSARILMAQNNKGQE
jgi:ferritin